VPLLADWAERLLLPWHVSMRAEEGFAVLHNTQFSFKLCVRPAALRAFQRTAA
jgi:hypothetical protein